MQNKRQKKMGPFRIAICGDAGSGKIALATNLYQILASSELPNTLLVECAVHSPLASQYFPIRELEEEEEIHLPAPLIDADRCQPCRVCLDSCEPNALLINYEQNPPVLDLNLCSSCGICFNCCPEDAIMTVTHHIGQTSFYCLPDGLGLAEGKLHEGAPMCGQLIRRLKEAAGSQADLIIYNAPIGTGCAVVETVQDADYVIIVTEPTPHGLYDIEHMTELLAPLGIPFGVVVNKNGFVSDEEDYFIQHAHLEVLGQIPFCRQHVPDYAIGQLWEECPAELQEAYMHIAQKVLSKISIHVG